MEGFETVYPKNLKNTSPDNIDLSPNLPLSTATQQKRVLNFLIDNYFLLLIGLILWYIIFLNFNIILPPQSILIYMPISWLIYYLFFEGIWNKTPAKYITGTKVITKSYNNPRFSWIIIRTLFRLTPFDPFTFLFSAKPYGWHDKYSQTIVVDEKNIEKAINNPILRILIIILDVICFLIILITTYFTFKYLVLNVIPDLKYINYAEVIKEEIASLTQNRTKIKEYSESTYGISLKYPGSWIKIGELSNADQPVVLFIKSNGVLFRIHRPETGYENMAVNSEYMKEYLDSTSTSTITSQGSEVINNQKYYKFITTDTVENKKLRVLNYITFKNDKIFIFSFAAYSEEFNINLPEAQKIFTSILIK